MNPDLTRLADIPGLVRCEEYPRDAMGEKIMELTHAVYPHDQVYGEYCTVQGYIDCPPAEVFDYMANTYSLLEWTWSVRKLRPVDDTGLFKGVDAAETPFYCRTLSNRQAMTVDYHCAWDRGEELWMIYWNRIIPAEIALKKPGSVVVWSNCRHPYYAKNPFPHLNDNPKRDWVGDWWPLFYGGHTIEFENLKAILEYRHKHRIPVGPHLAEGRP